MQTIAELNLETRIRQNEYTGRGIVIGRNSQGHWVQIYWISGRSSNSHNRCLVAEGSDLHVQTIKPEIERPDLLVYRAMRESGRRYIVSNGQHTDAIFESVKAGKTVGTGLKRFQYEDDEPHFTPRIAGYLDWSGSEPLLMLVILKKHPQSSVLLRQFFLYDSVPLGYGYCLTTYQENSNPLASFEGEPFLVPLSGDANSILKQYWQALNPTTKIALATKTIDSQSQSSIFIENKY